MAEGRAYTGTSRDRKVEKEKKRVKAIVDSKVKEMLSIPAGREFLYNLIQKLRPEEDIWVAGADLHMKAARHDVGAQLIRELNDVAPGTWARLFHEFQTKATPTEATPEEENDDE